MSLDQRTRDILALLNTDPLHQHDRERIMAAIDAEAQVWRSIVNPNRVRERLSDDHGNLTVNPNVLSGFYSRLAALGYLVPAGSTKNLSRGNGNKQSTVWRRAEGAAGDAA